MTSSPALASALRVLRSSIETHYGLRTESVSMISHRYAPEYPTAPQIAVCLPDTRFDVNARIRATDEESLLDLLTTPGTPVVEIDRTPTRVFLAVVLPDGLTRPSLTHP